MLGLVAGRALAQPVDRGGELGRLAPRPAGREPRRGGRVADPEACAPSVSPDPGGASATQRVRRDESGTSSAPLSSSGARIGAAIRLDGGDPDGQSASATRLTAAGPFTPPAREGREGHAGRVGDRVGAGDPGRVLGREGREAELSAAWGCSSWTTILGAGAGPCSSVAAQRVDRS